MSVVQEEVKVPRAKKKRRDGSTSTLRRSVESMPRKRTFILLRFGFWIAACYLLLVARDFEAPPIVVTAAIGGVLLSNLLLAFVRAERFEGMKLTGGIIVLDMAVVTAALVFSGEFGGEFFLLYFAVLFLAALGESLPLIILASVVGSVAYFWLGSGQGTDPAFWSSDTLIRFPFLLMVAVFFGYFVVRLRREQKRATEEARVSSRLEESRRAIEQHAYEVEYSNQQLETEVKERARAEKELEDANFKLKQASQTKTDFISVVSHELRTPLASIKNALKIIGSGKAGDTTPDQDRFLELATRNTVRLNAIIGDLLDLSKIEAGKIDFDYQELDLRPMLEVVCSNFEGQAEERGVAIELKASEGLPQVWADPGRVEQVVTNLVSNAMRHTEEGGRVTVWAREVPDGAEIAVEDTGVGISPEDQARVFDRFFQVGDSLTREAKGTGLGLSIVKQLLAGHGSRIRLQSELGEGSTFSFKLPILSSATVETFEFESKVMHYKTQAGFFTLLVVRLGDPETGVPEAIPDKEDLARIHRLVEIQFPRRADHVVFQSGSDRIVIVMLMTPVSGALVVKGRLEGFLAKQAREDGVAEAIVSGPACLPDDGSTGRAVVERALEGPSLREEEEREPTPEEMLADPEPEEDNPHQSHEYIPQDHAPQAFGRGDHEGGNR